MGLNVRTGVHSGEVEFRPDNVVRLAVSLSAPTRLWGIPQPGTASVGMGRGYLES